MNFSFKKAVEQKNEQKLKNFLAKSFSHEESVSFEDYQCLESALVETWHSQHEDLIHSINWTEHNDNRFVNPILEIALNRELYRWYDDELEATLRKCVHALKAMNTKESNEALTKLESIGNDNVMYALEVYH